MLHIIESIGAAAAGARCRRGMRAWLCTADVRAIADDTFEGISHGAQAAGAPILGLQLRLPLSDT